MYRLRLLTLCIAILIYLVGVVLFSAFTIHESRKSGSLVSGRGRAMDLSTGIIKTRYNIRWCKQLHFIQNPGSRPNTALVSFPGSGNTWLRYMLQQATGIYTGSIYMDYGLFKNGFPAELVTNNTVSVVKTHEWGPYARNKFDRAILLLRSPGDSIVAEFNRRSGGHIGYASADRYTRADGKYWRQFFYDKLTAWREMTLDWLNNFSGPIHIVTYDDLVSNLQHTLTSIIHFLELKVTDDDIKCAIEMREGIYRRKKRKTKLQPFTKDMKIQLRQEWSNVFDLINSMTDSNSSSYL